MAVKASSGITVTDVTDAYTVNLSSESVTISGNTAGTSGSGTVTTTVEAKCGNVPCAVAMGTVTKPTGVTNVTSKADTTNAKNLVVTVTYSGITTLAEVTLPLIVTGVNGESVTFEKKFSISVNKTGATGQNGKNGTNGTNGKDGDNPYTLVIVGNAVIKNNSGSTVLTAHVYQAGAEVTKVPSGCKLAWYTGTSTTASDSVAAGGTLPDTYTVTAGAVNGTLLVTAQLETA